MQLTIKSAVGNIIKLTRQHGWLIVLVLGSVSFSLWLMFFTFNYQEGQFLIRSHVWSDFAAHLPLIRSFSLGRNFPPQYPQFANEPIRYHFLFYWLAAILEQLGLNLVWSLNLLSALGLALLMIMIFAMTRLMAKSCLQVSSPASRAAGFLAVVLFLFNGSLTYFDYWQQYGLSWQSIRNIFHLSEFVNFGPWSGDIISAFWNWNIYTNQRHLGFSFALALIIIWPLVKTAFKLKTKDSGSKWRLNKQGLQRLWNKTMNHKWQLILLSLGLASLPFLNLATYGMTVFFIAAWFIFWPRLWTKYAGRYGLAILLSIPGFYYYWRLGHGSLNWQLGFLAAEPTLISIASYWWHNLGLYSLLWLALLLVTDQRQRKWWLIFSFYFILANVCQLSVDMINNHKLINFFQIGLIILLAAKLVQYWHGANISKYFFAGFKRLQLWLVRAFILILLPFLTLSGVMDAAAVVNDYQLTVPDAAQTKVGQWLLQSTEPDSTFVTTRYLYHPASLVGRKTYLDYGYFSWSMGYDDAARRRHLTAVFAADIDPDTWCQLMKQEAINYVFVTLNNHDLDLDVANSWLVATQEPQQQWSNQMIYSVAAICSQASQPL